MAFTAPTFMKLTFTAERQFSLNLPLLQSAKFKENYPYCRASIFTKITFTAGRQLSRKLPLQQGANIH
jgi:hypothetical protein